MADGTTNQNLADNAAEGLAISDKDVVAARKDGAKQAVADQAADTYKALTDGNLPGAPASDPYPGSDEIQMWAYVIEMGLDAFKDFIGRKDSPIPDEKVAGLLKLERAGQNRTEYVKALVKRLGIKSVYEVTDAGPPYTNDASSVTKL